MYIEEKKSGKNTQVYICKKKRVINKNGKSVPKSFIVKKLGFKEDLEKQYPGDAYKEYTERQVKLAESDEENKLSFIKINQDLDLNLDEQMCFNFGYIYPQTILKNLKLKEYLDTLVSETKIKYDFSSIVIDLILSQIINPKSKRGFYNAPIFYAKEKNYNLQDVYRALDILAKNVDDINTYTYKQLKKYRKLNSQIYYYDCTNFYFDTENYDDFRRMSKSKEGIYAPLVQLGALIDDKGFLVGMLVFDGSKNEQETLKTLEQKLQNYFSLKKIIICTDAGLNSSDNRYYNSQDNRKFICTQPLLKLKPHIKSRVKDDNNRKFIDGEDTELTPAKIDELYENASESDKAKYVNLVIYKLVNIKEDIDIKDEKDTTKKKKVKGFEQTLIVSYSLKYKLMQVYYFNRDLDKARYCIEHPSKFNKDSTKSFKRLIKNIKYDKKDGNVLENLYLNDEAIKRETEFYGYYCVATNIDGEASKIIELNKYRWNIEYMFRTMKTNLNARPIFVKTEAHIKGHLEIVCLAINVLRSIHLDMYKAMGKTNDIGKLDTSDSDYERLTIDKIMETLRSMNLTKLNTSEELFVPSFTRTKLTDALGKTYEINLAKSLLTGKHLRKFK